MKMMNEVYTHSVVLFYCFIVDLGLMLRYVNTALCDFNNRVSPSHFRSDYLNEFTSCMLRHKRVQDFFKAGCHLSTDCSQQCISSNTRPGEVLLKAAAEDWAQSHHLIMDQRRSKPEVFSSVTCRAAQMPILTSKKLIAHINIHLFIKRFLKTERKRNRAEKGNVLCLHSPPLPCACFVHEWLISEWLPV